MRNVLRKVKVLQKVRTHYLKYAKSPDRLKLQNLKSIEGFSLGFEILEFKFIDLNYDYDTKWEWWSRIYEYELVLNTLRDLNCSQSSWIHNSCWGFQGCHIKFKTELESNYPNVLNSDLQLSPIGNTTVYDVSKPCPAEWEGAFDFVINISTIEGILHPHIQVFENLLKMVKIGGYLVVTFDFPGIQLDMFETLFGRKIEPTLNPVTGSSSPMREDQFGNLKVGYFVIQRL
jgi:hypothetical protein